MAYGYDETRQRQLQRREEHRRQLELKKKRQRRIFLGIAAAAVILGICALVIALVRHTSQPEPEAVTVETTQPEETTPLEPETVISLAFGGDLNITDKVVSSGSTGDGYDYTDVFMDVAPLLAGADLSALNLEGNLVGAPYGSQNTSAPMELVQALSSVGVDLVQMANSCSVNNGLLGLTESLENLRQAGLEPVGAFASDEEHDRQKGFTLRSIHGVKVAFVSFTKGMDDLGLPVGGEKRVNLLYTDYTSTYQDVDTEGIKAVLDAVALEKPDITVALLHWGSEYNSQISSSQKRIVDLMLDNGVDAIVGTHSHYVQKIEYDQKEGTVVAYSLGDFMGDGERSGTGYSIVLQLQITRDNRTGKAKITDMDYTPIYNVRTSTEEVSTMKLLRLEEAIEAYDANSVDKVTEEVYTAMKSALTQIRKKVSPD